MSRKINKGFTTIELLVYMGILSFLIMILSTIFVSIVDVQLDSKSTSDVDQDGRYILARLAYDFGSAQSVASPSTPGSSSGTLQISINSINYTYNLDGSGNLQLTNNLGTNNLNSINTTIPSITFQRIGNGGINDTIRVTFTVKSTTQRHTVPEQRTYQTTFGI